MNRANYWLTNWRLTLAIFAGLTLLSLVTLWHPWQPDFPNTPRSEQSR